ncbi:nicotinate phosphoribosyltransferase, partial [Kitasatospora sp. NPDC058263]
ETVILSILNHDSAIAAAAPVDGYGVGTSLVTGSGHPTCAMVYKLVARAQVPDGPLLPVAKRSAGAKSSVGGRKWAARRPDQDGVAEAEVVGTGPIPAELEPHLLQVPLVRAGEVVGREPLGAARERLVRALAGLPLSATQLSKGDPVLPTELIV